MTKISVIIPALNEATVIEQTLAHLSLIQGLELIVVDGGKAQINTALKFQERVGLRIPVVSVVKNERHKPKGILGNPKMAQNFEKEILLVNSEAHRFSIAYHRLDKRLMN